MTTQHSPAGAPLKVFVSNSLRGVLDALRPEFERASGYALDISYDPAQVMLRRIGAGESADLVILGAAAIDTLVEQGKVDGASRRTLGRCGSGLAVRSGAPRPDIGSVDALKRALLEAKSIIHTSEGASGIHFARLVETLGIADAVKAKARTQPGGLVAQRVASGEVELGVQQIPELLPYRASIWWGRCLLTCRPTRPRPSASSWVPNSARRRRRWWIFSPHRIRSK
ncbi:MAG TPA: substrate-binding domain-containing protein [Burkholderiales bacterium]|nr:substrate-binding domain-containing protein [Burkholderiales bacterium]